MQSKNRTRLFSDSVSGIKWSKTDSNRFFIGFSGTYLKWETALRKALEYVASHDRLRQNGVLPEICLLLVVQNDEITTGDKRHLRNALGFIGVKVIFVC